MRRFIFVLILFLIAPTADGQMISGSGGKSFNPFFGVIAFAALGTDNVSHIYTVTGTNSPIQLTSGSNGDQTPEWSPDGTRIAFFRVSAADGSAYSYVMNADGSNQVNLSPSSPGAGLGDFLPSFSADGTKLIFMHVDSLGTCTDPIGIAATTSIWSMSSTDGSNRTVLVNGSVTNPVCFLAEPQANPVGGTMIFTCQPLNGSSQVCRSNTDGSSVGNITDDPGGVTYGDPHWSPDSTKIVYSYEDTSSKVNIWVMNSDASNKINLTNFTSSLPNPGHYGSDPGFSPNGTQIVFQDITNLMSQISGLSVINVDGTGYKSLGIPCAYIGCGPRFQPN